MKVLEIPIASSAAHFVQEHEIFKKSFFLEFEWLEREGIWLLHIFDQERRALRMGVKLIPNWALYTHREDKEPFSLMLLEQSSGLALDRRNLNQDFKLVAHEAL